MDAQTLRERMVTLLGYYGGLSDSVASIP